MTGKEKIDLLAMILVYLTTIPVDMADYQANMAPQALLMDYLTTMLELAFIATGLTLMLVSVMQKVTGERVARSRVARYFLTFAILINLYYHSFLLLGGQPG